MKARVAAAALSILLTAHILGWWVPGARAQGVTSTATLGFIVIQPTATQPVIGIQPSRTPTSPSSRIQTRTPTPTITPTLPSLALPSPTPTPLGLVADLPATPTLHWDPYVPDFPLTLPSPTPTPGSFTVPDEAQVDLSLTDIEVTQGLQSLDNDMPLMELRMTYARVYVRSHGSDWFPVHGILQAWRDGEYLGIRGPENGPIPAFLGGGDRTKVDHTLNFRLPTDWRYGDVTLRAFIYSEDPQSPFEQEPIWVNNFREVEVEFHQGNGVSLSLWPIHLHEGYDPTKPEILFTEDHPDTSTVLAGLQRLIPTWGIFLHGPPIDRLYCLGWTGGEAGVGPLTPIDQHGPCEFDLAVNGGAQQVNAVMSYVDFFTDGPWDDVYNYGMVDPSFVDEMLFYNDKGEFINYTGLALYGQTHGVMDVSTWEFTPWQMTGGEAMAHEIGHRLGLAHAECSGEEEKGGALDPDFPWTLADCRIAQLSPAGFYGFDVLYGNIPGPAGPTVISNDPAAPEPNRGFPLMGYQDPKWMDAYYWCATLDALGVACDRTVVPFLASRPGAGLMAMADSAAAGPAGRVVAATQLRAASQEDVGHLVVMGQVDRRTGSAQLVHVMKVAKQPSGDQDGLLGGEGLFRSPTSYSLALVDRSGEVLTSAPIYDGSDAHDQAAILVFVTAFPFDPQASALQLREGGRVIAERGVSAHAPVVRLLTPNGGEALAAPLEIRWEASDADGDSLDYTIQYSPDGGEAWQAIAYGLLDPALRLDSLAILTGSEQGRLRVLASDGVLTGQDESDGVFRVPNTAPLATLSSPAHRTVYPLGATVVLSGSGTDREDGILPAESLAWESDRDGPLGTGAEVALDSLSPGLHVITLRATDSLGATDEAKVAIAVDPAVVVHHLSGADLETVAATLDANALRGAGIPEDSAPSRGPFSPPGAALAVVGVTLLLGLAGIGLLALALRRRSR